MVTFSETFMTHGTLEFLLPLLLEGVEGVSFVVGTHVIHEIRRHSEANVTFRTDILGRKGQRGEGRRQQGGHIVGRMLIRWHISCGRKLWWDDQIGVWITGVNVGKVVVPDFLLVYE